MKYFQIFSIVMLYCLSCSNEKPIIDLLITRINNQQIEMTHQFVSLPEMKSPAADSLIQIGKTATEKLIAVLNDTSKGIIANWILSAIWYDERKIKIQSDSLQTDSSHDEGKGMVIIIDGLKYYYKEETGSYGETEELEKNKKEWQRFIETMNTDSSIHH